MRYVLHTHHDRPSINGLWLSESLKLAVVWFVVDDTAGRKLYAWHLLTVLVG